ncbi:cell envelope-associated transcriptional attenuator LytR-CpsA-Psr [Gracilibacillus boraciitolerans JCM 21714]|uniref:Cell envelope-associated transcriptional attenuator LytR-CpsA-Psr n=1 Tax=Gracilibacillus boraciitolerans JCM 21714 TaxID=1298598 RepID=W4VQJ5_9BACI|nr:cell envelope-associated transcriptional attenuator LytR-CpsA-Psr [Gracilibacillus boraciitolerans JCM 21714]
MDQNEGGSRSDALILATLNKDDSSVKMLSIPRDTYVYVPERDMNTKINHAHAYGGVKATIETVEEFLDIPVDYYVSMNFNAFIDVVETLNGINVNVEKEIQEQNSKDEPNAIHLQPGDQLLNGEEALAYARTRKIDNDIERGKRQQEIMKAIADKATSVKSVLKYDDLIEAVGDNMKTNMTFDEIKGLTSYLGNGKLNIETNILEGEDSYIDGVYYFQANEQSVANIQTELKNHLDLSNPAAQTTN